MVCFLQYQSRWIVFWNCTMHFYINGADNYQVTNLNQLIMKQKFSRPHENPMVFLVCIFMAVFSFQAAVAQNTISGKVTDNSGPLPGVNVVVQGTTNGTVTDFDGNYSIRVPEDATTLVFSYIGYTTRQISINGRTEIDITMTEDAQALSEVVVVGYGTQRKADLTGAVGSIGAAQIETKPITSPDQALAGTIAGVNITNRSGDPGAPISVNIRGIGTPGVNDPLWVIDGVPIVQTTNITVNTSSTTDSNPLAGLNANDIESIDVLKDAASTAIYGARAANGVIIVTTKRGKAGDARVTYATLPWRQPATGLMCLMCSNTSISSNSWGQMFQNSAAALLWTGRI
jgi:TonB-dependent SusC/RagA subfamily outer membrane receptor